MSSISAARKARKKQRLYRRQNGLCHWCGVRMDLTLRRHVIQWSTLATFEHLDDRFSPDRGKRPGARRIVLACHKCNHERGIESQRMQDIDVLHAASRHAPNDVLGQKLAEALGVPA